MSLNTRPNRRQIKRSSKTLDKIEKEVDKMCEDMDALLDELDRQMKIIQKIKRGRRKSAPKKTTTTT